MHCVCLAELAAILSAHSSSILNTEDGISSPALAAYWTATRSRMDLWHRCLARHREAASIGNHQDVSRWWKQHRGIAEEIIVGELLCRVMAALAADLDARGGVDECSPIAHSVYLGHLDVSNRLQRILLTRGPDVTDSVRLNRLRHAMGGWIDTMVGRMTTPHSAAIGYAVNTVRANRFSREMSTTPEERSPFADQGEHSAGQLGALLMNASMLDMIRHRTDPRPSLPVSNAEVARSILLTLRPSWFECFSGIHSRTLRSAAGFDEPPTAGYSWNAASGTSDLTAVSAKPPKQHPMANRWIEP